MEIRSEPFLRKPDLIDFLQKTRYYRQQPAMSIPAIATSGLFLFAALFLFVCIQIPERFDVNILIMALSPVAFVWFVGLFNLLALIAQGGFPWLPQTWVRYAVPIAIHIGLGILSVTATVFVAFSDNQAPRHLITFCAIFLPLLLQASARLPASFARYALIFQGIVFFLALAYGFVVANEVRKAVANSPELKNFQAPVPVDNLKIAREFLATLPADAPLESYVQFTTDGRYDDAVKDAVVEQLLARPDLQQLLITALHGDSYQRYGAHSVLMRSATPLNLELAGAFEDSLLLTADDLARTLAAAPPDAKTDDQRDSATYTTSEVATRFATQGFATTLYPAMQRLQQVAGPPRSKFGGATGRHALATWLQRNQSAR